MEMGVMSRRGLLGSLAAGSALGLVGCSGEEAPNPFESPGGGSEGAATKESPMLTKLVESGDLPPLEERLPKTPMVVQPIDTVGQYGGTLRSASLTDNVTPLSTFAHAGFLEWNVDQETRSPSVAESFEVDDENRVYTVKIREGLKWSDGEPFTKDDIEFTFNDFFSNTTLVPSAPYYFSDADQNRPTLDWVDDLTFTVTFGTPTPLWAKYMAHPGIGYQFMKPAHYLGQFHPDHADKDEVEAAAKKAGFDSWDLHFHDRLNPWTNPDLPVMGAFRVVTPSAASGTASMERNPFYFKTDPDGRQLPYIDEISVQILGQEALDLRAANGEIDFLGNGLAFGSSQVLLENAEARGYSVRRWANFSGTASLCPNLSHKDEGLREIFADVRFRAAVSHAINRDDINNALMSSVGVIRHPLATEGSEFEVEGGGGMNFIEYDVDEANKLLDEVGMTKSGQWRTRPDGSPFEPVLIFVESDKEVPLAAAFQMVAQNLAEVGIKLVLKPVDSTLYGEVRAANDFDIDGVGCPSDDMDMEGVWWVPTAGNSHTAPGYGLYYASNGETGIKPSDEFQQLLDNWDKLRVAKSDEERIAAGKAIMEQHNEKVYMIGLLRPPFQPVVVTDRTKNVRDDEPSLSFYYGREGISKPEQIWFSE